MKQLSEYSAQYLPVIEQHLFSTLNNALKTGFPELKESILYQFGFSPADAGKARGKRVRPMLVLLSADLLSMDWHELLPAASAIEMLHNFSLIHDDIEDHSPLRRGKETIWKKWGTEKAVNIGDALFILAVQTIQSTASQFDLQCVMEAERLFMQAAFSIMQGQQMDMAFEGDRNINLEDYLQMIHEKTAALLAFSCEIPAVLNGSEAEIRELLHGFGLNLGMAFQIYDDWLGIWGKGDQTGKTECSDLIERKLSYPVLLGLKQSPQFCEMWQSQESFSAAMVRSMVEILTSEGIETEVLAKAAHYNEIALNALGSIRGNESAKNALRTIAEDLIKRKK